MGIFSSTNSFLSSFSSLPSIFLFSMNFSLCHLLIFIFTLQIYVFNICTGEFWYLQYSLRMISLFLLLNIPHQNHTSSYFDTFQNLIFSLWNIFFLYLFSWILTQCWNILHKSGRARRGELHLPWLRSHPRSTQTLRRMRPERAPIRFYHSGEYLRETERENKYKII